MFSVSAANFFAALVITTFVFVAFFATLKGSRWKKKDIMFQKSMGNYNLIHRSKIDSSVEEFSKVIWFIVTLFWEWNSSTCELKVTLNFSATSIIRQMLSNKISKFHRYSSSILPLLAKIHTRNTCEKIQFSKSFYGERIDSVNKNVLRGSELRNNLLTFWK